MITAKLLTAKGSLPAGSTIEIAEQISLGHYSSSLAYFDLRLVSGEILRMVHFYNDLDHAA